MNPFKCGGATVALAATTASASNTALPGECSQVRIYNAGPNAAFIRFASAALTADATVDMPIASGNTEVFTKGGSTAIAAICATGSATVYVTPGVGE